MRVNFLAQGNNGAFAGSRTHDWLASTDYEPDALPTTRNCRISCAEHWSQSSLCEQKLYRFVLLTGRVFKIDETLHGKCKLSIPVVILTYRYPLSTPHLLSEISQGYVLSYKNRTRPAKYHCDWWCDSHSWTLHRHACIPKRTRVRIHLAIMSCRCKQRQNIMHNM